jgi:hypothetical protein
MRWHVVCRTPGCKWQTSLSERTLAENWREFHEGTHPGHMLTVTSGTGVDPEEASAGETQGRASQGSPSFSRAPRYHLLHPIRFSIYPKDASDTSDTGKGCTQNVSLTGACLDLSDRLRPGRSLTVTLEDVLGQPCLAAIVVWAETRSRAGGRSVFFRHGVRFAQMTSAQRARLGAFLQACILPERLVLARPVRARLLPDGEADVLDLSLQGAGVRMESALPPLAVRVLALPAALGGVELPVRVAYARPIRPQVGSGEAPRAPLYEMGLTFTEVSFQQQSALRGGLSLLAHSIGGERTGAIPDRRATVEGQGRLLAHQLDLVRGRDADV